VGGKITAKYGVLREDGYAKRVTFIIDKKGIIRHIIEKVNVLDHAAEIVNAVNSLPK
jgi:peroxiredoxin Q/BCP